MQILRLRAVSFLLTPVIAGAVLTVLAPLGTHNFDFPVRATYWISLCIAGGLGAMAVQAIMRRRWPAVTDWRYILFQSLGSTLAVAPFVIGLSGRINLMGWLVTLFYIWIIAIVITAFGTLASRPKAEERDDLLPSRPALMDRLPIHMRDAELYGVTSEDHYVRVHTSAGDHMILMRLADVEGLATPVSGLSPHRSWWVAERGVANVRRESGRTVMELKDGTQVPVSRSGAARVKEAGWLN